MTAPEQRTYIASRRVMEAFGPGTLGEALAIVIESQPLDESRQLRVRGLRGEERTVTPVYPRRGDDGTRA